jgi:hypothetical protein
MKSFIDTVLKNTKNDILLNLKLLLIWGAGVGSVIVQITNYLRKGFVNFSKFEVFLFFCTIFAIIIDELHNVIFNKEDLTLKKIFNTINNTVYTFVNIISYSFIIPILEISWNVKENGYNEIIIRFIIFAIISTIGNFSKELISELIKRFEYDT